MDCTAVREALSARLDGEESPISPELVSAHSRHCQACQNWAQSVSALQRRVRLAPADDIPDLTPAILAAVGTSTATEKGASGLRPCRILLVVCAFLQLIATIPALLDSAGAPIHLDHELGSWDLALAIGFLVVAATPARAWGMLPLVAAVGLTLTAASIIDITAGHASLQGESPHVTELMGVAFVFMVARFSHARGSYSALG